LRKLLITGVSGFVGGHFINFLATQQHDFEIHGISRSLPVWDFFPGSLKLTETFTFHQADLIDIPRIKSLIERIQPDYILHLAAQSSVAESWKNPVLSFVNNTNIFLNIIDTVRLNDNAIRVLSVGSSEQYGRVSDIDLPLIETSPQRPANPYAVARVAQEQLAKIYAEGYGINICCTRSFNHCGPGQSDRFVVSGIVRQFVRISHKLQEPVIHIGNGSIIRDFIDVHDVVRAYLILLEKGKRGEVYNICSGKGRTIRDIVTELSELLGVSVEIREEKSEIRPIDNPRIIGSNEKMVHEFDWHPSIGFEQTLWSMYNCWNKRQFRESEI
jgi:GDP-4-dehydro-6-deoxy-D-mannose reductase